MIYHREVYLSLSDISMGYISMILPSEHALLKSSHVSIRHGHLVHAILTYDYLSRHVVSYRHATYGQIPSRGCSIYGC